MELQPFDSSGKCPKCGSEKRDLQWCEATAFGPEMLRVCCADCLYHFPDELPLDATPKHTCGECVTECAYRYGDNKAGDCKMYRAKPAAPQQPELKPCPFDGKSARAWTEGEPGSELHHVTCDECHAEVTGDVWKETIAAWNRRTP